jgi:tetratricopeptide (TPR) repeat protein
MILRLAVFTLLCLGSPLLLRANEQGGGESVAKEKPTSQESVAAASPAKQENKQENAEHAGSSASEPAQEYKPSAYEEAEIVDLLKYAQSSSDDGRLDTALIAYRQLLEKHLTRAQERIVLLGYARVLRKQSELTKAVAIYEKVLKEYPVMDDVPEIYLELGRAQRALGAYTSAISRFYSVINSTIKLPEDGAEKYRQLAKTAQFEIAETHFQAGNYAEASRFYSRLRLLDLAQTDRAKAHFKSAYSLFLAEDYLGATTSLRSFLDQNPDDENVPEAHYYLAVAYRKLQRPMESLVEAMELLRVEKTRTAKDPKRWSYWQRKTGNQIANEFYEQGDFGNALTIYQTLSELSSDAAWRLPVLYQIALCQERMGLIDQAMTSYQSILDKLSAAKGDVSAQADLANLAQMANWRLGQINWQHKTEQDLFQLMPQRDSKPATPAPTHDSSGNSATSPSVVR